MQDEPTTESAETTHIESATPLNTYRRRFLKSAATAGGIIGIGGFSGIALAQETTFELGGEVAGWMGRAPSSIEGQTNPTLQLQPGQTYAIRWENVDGLPHNVVIVDTNGNQLERTELMSEQGTTQTLEFTATTEMAEYFCEAHPTSMRGSVQVGGEEGNETVTGTRTPQEETEPYIPRGATVGIETIAEGFVSPVGFETPPEGTEPSLRYILDQIGLIYVNDADGLRDEPFLDLQDQIVDVGGREDTPFDERGLLGLAFHPNFSENRTFYVRYSAPPREGTPDDYDHTSVLSEFEAADDLSSANPDSERVLLEIPSPQFNHNGGTIAFGPDDGFLYMGIGDGGGANDTGLGHVEDWYGDNAGGNGQDVTENLLGSILRIDVDNQEGGKPYAIPDDNPLVGMDGLDEHYAWGFRNPWRIGFSNGNLFAADNGQNLFEEVDIVRKGGNYGWNVREATHCFSTENPTQPPEECPTRTPEDIRGGEPLIPPVIEYPHTADGQPVGVSVIGGYTYENDAISNIQGKYIFGDYSQTGADPQGRIFAATPSEEDELWSMEDLVIAGTDNGELNRYILAFGRDNNDQLYVLTSETGVIEGETGSVHQIVPPQQPAQTGGGNATTATNTTNATTGTEAGTSTAAGEATGAAESGTTEGSEDGTSGTSTDASGPGFGVLAALSGLTIGAARFLFKRDDE